MRRSNALVVTLILLTIVFVPAAYPAYAQPGISLSPSSGPPGILVTVTGSGFDPTDTSVTLSNSPSGLGASGVTCGVTSGLINSGCSFVVSNTAGLGNYVVTATGNTVSDSASTSFQVTNTASISINPVSGPPGVTVVVSGSGFSPSDTFVTLSSTPTGLGASGTCLLSSGTITSCSFTVSNSAALGGYSVIATGNVVSDAASTPFTVVGISLNPTSGPRGTAVVVSGSGFSSSDSYVTLSSTPSSLGATGVMCTVLSGSINPGCSFTVSNSANLGSYVVTATGTLSDSASATFTVKGPTIAVNPTSGPVGTVLSVTGGGFNSADYCNSGSFSSSSLAFTAATCSMTNGQITSASLTVAGQPLGTYTVVLTPSTLDSAQTTFTVTPRSIALTPSSAAVGSTVTVSGSGFSGSDTSCTLFGSGSIMSYTCSISGGSLTASFVVGNVPAGSYTITATGHPGGDAASAQLTVLPPTITLNPTSAQPGVTVSVSGSDFYTTDTSCTLVDTGSISTQNCIISNGILTGSFVVAAVSPGPYTITADTSGGDSGVAKANFQVLASSPAITLNPTSAQVGATVHVSGSGFSSGDSTCSLSGGGSIATFTCIISSGALTASFVIANVAPGPYTITATGNPGSDSAPATLTVLSPSIALSPSIGETGITVHVTGTGFFTSDTTCSLSDSGSIASSSCSISGGSLTATYLVANVPAGLYPITATGSPGGDSAVANFQVTTLPVAIALNPTSAQVGASVSVSGSGFSPGDTTCALSDSGSISTSTCSVTGGVLTGSLTVANVAPGPYVITATGSPGSDSASATLTVVAPSITLNPSIGQTGITVDATGTGFYTTDTSCSLASTAILSQSCSIAGGSLTATFSVANVAAGSYLVTAHTNGADTGKATANFQVTILPVAIALNPTSAQVGTTISVSGSGFSPGDTACSLSDSGSISSPTCAVSGGTLTATFTVANVAPGTYTITATGIPGSDSASATLTVLPPSITLNPSSALAGATVSVSGTGFYTSDVTCSLTGGGSISSQTCTISGGILTGSFIVAGAAPGLYTITAITSGGDSGLAKANFQLLTGPPPTIKLNPGSGPAGTVVTVSGSGFASTDAGPITNCQSPPDFGISSPTSTTVILSPTTCTFTATGDLDAFTFTAGNVPKGSYIIQVKGDPVGDVGQATFNVTSTAPSITLNPTSGPVGTIVTVSGSGYAPADAGPIPACFSPPDFGLTSPTSTSIITAANTCTFTASGALDGFTFTVGSVSPGPYVLQVKGDPAGDLGQATFTVTTTTPTITLNPNSGPVGIVVVVTGAGFAPADVCGPGSFSSTPTGLITSPSCTMSSGKITSASFTVANSKTPGPYTVTLDPSLHDDASATFTITAPAISLNPSSGPVGAAVTITGSGFSPSDAGPCSSLASFPSSPSLFAPGTSCSISATGQVAGSFTVSTSANLISYTVTVSGAPGGDSASATFTVTKPTPSITLTPGSGPIGSSVSISGLDFNPADVGPCSSVTSFPTGLLTSVVCSISATGHVAGSFKVKTSANLGSYTVTVSGSPGGDSASTTFTVIPPTITLNPTFGPVSTSVTITGSNFDPADVGPCSALTSFPSSPTLFAASPSCSISATGQASGSFTVSTSANLISYTVTVTGAPGGDSASASFTVTGPTATITLTPTSGHIGATVKVTGSGWAPSDSTCSLTGPPVASGPTCTISGGTLTGLFTVYSQPAGFYSVTAHSTGGAFETVSATFQILPPTITLSPASGPNATRVTVSGTGFFTADSSCSFYTPNAAIASPYSCQIVPPSGNVSAYFYVAKTPAGPYTIEIVGATGCPADCASATFTVDPTLALNPSSVVPGATVNISGADFNPSDTTCTISSTKAGLISSPVTCSISSGTATGSFVTGSVSSGSYTVTVTGSTGDAASATLTVTAPSQVTMTVSYTVVGGGSPTAPVFNYVLKGVSKSLPLTKTPKAVSVDAGSTWSVSPNPLTGSTSSQRWYSTQTLTGTASSTTIVFSFQHQYFLTMQTSGPGTVTPISGWNNAGATVTIKATANAGHKFKSWTGSGTGSFTGTTNPAKITMNSAITETATFT